MRNLLLIMPMGFLLLSFISTGSKLLSQHKAGDVTIGMTPDEVYGLVGKENAALVDLYLEGTYSPALVLYDSKKRSQSLVIEIVCEKVWRINVYDQEYKTKMGVGVGSTFGELKKRHKVNSIELGEGNVFAYVEDLDMSFCLDYSKAGYYDLKVDDINDDARILKILVL